MKLSVVSQKDSVISKNHNNSSFHIDDRIKIKNIWDSDNPWEVFKENIANTPKRIRQLTATDVVVIGSVGAVVIYGLSALNRAIDAHFPRYLAIASKVALSVAFGSISSRRGSKKNEVTQDKPENDHKIVVKMR